MNFNISETENIIAATKNNLKTEMNFNNDSKFSENRKLRNEKIKHILENRYTKKSTNLYTEEDLDMQVINENSADWNDINYNNINNNLSKINKENIILKYSPKLENRKNNIDDLDVNYFKGSSIKNILERAKNDSLSNAKEKKNKMKKFHFKHLYNSKNKSNKKSGLRITVTNSNENNTFNNFSPQLTYKNSYNARLTESSKLGNFDPYMTYNSTEKSNSNKKSGKKDNYTKNFFLSPKIKKECISSINFTNKIISNKHNNNENIKNKEINKIKFSYFSEFASLKKIDSLKIRNHYNSIESIKLEFDEKNINKNKKKKNSKLEKRVIKNNCVPNNNKINFMNFKYNSTHNDSGYVSNNHQNFNNFSNGFESESQKYENFMNIKNLALSKIAGYNNNINGNNNNTYNLSNANYNIRSFNLNNSNYQFLQSKSTKNNSTIKINSNYNSLYAFNNNNKNNLSLPKLSHSNSISNKSTINEKLDNYQKYQDAFIQNLRFYNYNTDKLNNNNIGNGSNRNSQNKYLNNDKNCNDFNQINKINQYEYLNLNNEIINSPCINKDDSRRNNKLSGFPKDFLIKRFNGNRESIDFNNKNVLDTTGYCITKIKKIDKIKN